jgi:uncharacterized protein with HEPN domain
MRDNVDIQVIEKISNYCSIITQILDNHNRDYEEFKTNMEFYAAVSMFEMQIGELSKSLSTEFKEQTQVSIPWTGIRGMRNMYAHEYAKMNAEDIWNTAIELIPVLHEVCRNHLKENQ